MCDLCLPCRPDLKLIVMSATINAKMFSDYFSELNGLAKVIGLLGHTSFPPFPSLSLPLSLSFSPPLFLSLPLSAPFCLCLSLSLCTDCAPTYTIKNVAYPVTEYFLEDILGKIKLVIALPSFNSTFLFFYLFFITATIYRSLSYRPQCKQFKPRPHYTRYGEGRSEYMKEQEEEQEREQYLYTLETNQTYPLRVIDSLRNFNEKTIDLNLIFELMKYICSNLGEGAILVFLPGWDTISKLNDLLMASPVFRGSSYLIIPLHSMMPTSNQQRVRGGA